MTTAPLYMQHSDLSAACLDSARAMQDEQVELARIARPLSKGERVVVKNASWENGRKGRIDRLTFSPSGNGAYIVMPEYPHSPFWFPLAELEATNGTL